MASTIKVDKLEGSTGSTITVPTGQTFTITDGIAASTIASGTIADARLPTVTVAKGGTNQTSFTAGDVLYATGSTTLAKLPKGTAEQVLAMNSGATAPDWGSVDLTVLPTISVEKGGTALASFTAGDILYATGTTTLAKLAKGTTLQTLKMNVGATAPEWATVASASSDAVKVASGSMTSGGSPSEIVEDGCFTSAYRFYQLFIADLQSSVDAAIYIQMRNSNANITGAYYRGNSTHPHFSSASYATNQHGHWNTTDGWRIGGNGDVNAHVVSAMGGQVYFPYGDNISTYNTLHWKTWHQESSTTGQYNIADGAGIYQGYTQYDGFRLYPSAGNFVEGEYTVIGYKQ